MTEPTEQERWEALDKWAREQGLVEPDPYTATMSPERRAAHDAARDAVAAAREEAHRRNSDVPTVEFLKRIGQAPSSRNW